MPRRILIAALALAALPLTARADCELQKIAEVQVQMQGLRPMVEAKVNGHDTTFMVDTGAFFSGVSDEAAARFGMKSVPVPFGLSLRSVGGATTLARAVEAEDFEFAGSHMHKMQFLVGGRLGSGASAGVMGANVLGHFDMEYDLANGVVRFFRAADCGDKNLAYWSAGKSLSRISMVDQRGPNLARLVSKAKVNGRDIRVTWDSGSPLSVLSRGAAARAGIQVNAEGVEAGGITYGIYGKGQETFLAPFDAFAIGDEEIRNTRLRVSDIDLGDSDMLLGADFFLSHRILVSRTQNKIYFTYNGGSVFRLDRTAQQLALDGTAPGASADKPADKAAEDGPKTASDFQRRGQASAARRDYAAAIADFSKAIELEPNDGGHYHARALARLGARQPVLAMADLSEALKRQPDDVPALTTRGELYLAAHDPERAKADFDQATKLAPDNSRLPIDIGAAYARAGLFEAAIHEMDGWVAAHPKDERLPEVLTARCGTRGMWGQQLEAALADCDYALKRNRVSAVLETRGLVLLRMNRLDEALAQFDAALKLQPRSPEGLLGRGVARLQKGMKAEGEADIAQARTLAPGLVQQFRRLGLVPGDAAGKADGPAG